MHHFFVLKTTIIIVYILIYVNDILIIGSSSATINKMIDCLNEIFVVTDLGSLNFFLDVKTLQCSDDLYLTQHKYIVDLFKQSNMDKAKPYRSPTIFNCHLNSIDEKPFEDKSIYQSIVDNI